MECKYCIDYLKCDHEDKKNRVYDLRDGRGDCFKERGKEMDREILEKLYEKFKDAPIFLYDKGRNIRSGFFDSDESINDFIKEFGERDIAEIRIYLKDDEVE